MAAALAAVAFVAVLVVGFTAAAYGLHRALRPTEMTARSVTALRSLQPRGGRHRFSVRHFEVAALATSVTAALAVLFCVAAQPATGFALGLGGGGAMLVAAWWTWRRGALRTVEADAHPPPHAGVDRAGASGG